MVAGKPGYTTTTPTSHPRSVDERFDTTGLDGETVTLDVAPYLPLDSVSLQEDPIDEGVGAGQYSVAGKVVTLHGAHAATTKGLRIVYRVKESPFLPGSTVIVGEVEVKNDAGNPVPVVVVSETLTKKTVAAVVGGDTTIHTPAAGKKVRLYYFGYSAGPNVTGVLVGLKLAGYNGGLVFDNQFLSTKGQPYARNIQGGKRFIEGAVDGALVVNLDVGQTVHVSVELEEV